MQGALFTHSGENMIFISLVAAAFIWGFCKALKKHQAAQSKVFLQRRNGWRN